MPKFRPATRKISDVGLLHFGCELRILLGFNCNFCSSSCGYSFMPIIAVS